MLTACLVIACIGLGGALFCVARDAAAARRDRDACERLLDDARRSNEHLQRKLLRVRCERDAAVAALEATRPARLWRGEIARC